MNLVKPRSTVQLRLRKDLLRSIKRGHAWCFSDALERAEAPAGSQAILWDRKQDREIASGIYDPQHPIPLRICQTNPPLELDDHWMASRLVQAVELRKLFFDSQTSGYRLVAGEGDGLPGLIIDVYGEVAVMKLDGGAPEQFYLPYGIANWLTKNTAVKTVVLRSRVRGEPGEVIAGDAQLSNPVEFLENGMKFTADVIHGQKTGFFLDQRENRELIRRASCGKRVLNLFSFSGGFSVAAGCGGALDVTSVDVAEPAIDASQLHWDGNGLPDGSHTGIAADCFEFLDNTAKGSEPWDIVVCDPPSFAPSEKAKERALPAYRKLAQCSARVTAPGGLLALASCSSHVGESEFDALNREALGSVRRKPTLIASRGLPPDHLTPAAMPELRYLKFQLFRLD
ncbi:MAG: 23S rRNA (cytosine(2499)-C(5))-methyltransferase [Aureliella sp.]